MLRLSVLGLSLALVAPAVGGDQSVATKATAFQNLSYPKALARAKGDNKLVMIDFYADWCGPCKQLDAQTFRNAKVRQFLQDKTVAIRVNVDMNLKLARQYNVTGIPCLVFLNGEGRQVGRIVGFQPAQQFLEKARGIVK